MGDLTPTNDVTDASGDLDLLFRAVRTVTPQL
jgi:hypothetical protein